jgi:hypothetical protein
LSFPQVQIDLRQGLPEPLQEFCRVEAVLVCENLDTGVRQAGRYIFELTVIPVGGPADPPITLATDPILIEARPPQILNFLVNGQPMQPKYTVPLVPGQPPPNWWCLGRWKPIRAPPSPCSPSLAMCPPRALCPSPSAPEPAPR